MKRRGFWNGFVAGMAAVIGGSLLVARFRRGGLSRILRLEKSIQIAASVHDVWETWTDLDSLASMSSVIQQVHSFGDRSRWIVNVNGVPMQWEAEITQIIPYQAIGWKSISGPKHSGRITFTALGNDTVVHVQMNYAPPMRLLRRALAPFSGDIEGYIEQALREFKAGLEKRGGPAQTEPGTRRETGTYGAGPELLTETQRTRFGGAEATQPPGAKR
jgi:uncharacterized membrane protein